MVFAPFKSIPTLLDSSDEVLFNSQNTNRRRSRRMSTGIILVGQDSIVMATDSRDTSGTYHNHVVLDKVQKLWNLGTKIGLISTSTEGQFGDWLIRLFLDKISGFSKELSFTKTVEQFIVTINKSLKLLGNL